MEIIFNKSNKQQGKGTPFRNIQIQVDEIILQTGSYLLVEFLCLNIPPLEQRVKTRKNVIDLKGL